MKIDPKLFDYLGRLEQNNNRVWFKSNKAEFDIFNADIKHYFQSVFELGKSIFLLFVTHPVSI